MTRYFGPSNLANYINDEAENILNELYSISDQTILKEKYKTLQNLYESDIPYIGLCFNKIIVVYNKSLATTITPTWYNLFNNIETWYRKNS